LFNGVKSRGKPPLFGFALVTIAIADAILAWSSSRQKALSVPSPKVSGRFGLMIFVGFIVVFIVVIIIIFEVVLKVSGAVWSDDLRRLHSRLHRRHHHNLRGRLVAFIHAMVVKHLLSYDHAEPRMNSSHTSCAPLGFLIHHESSCIYHHSPLFITGHHGTSLLPYISRSDRTVPIWQART
jgi:hypothetical protein